MTRQSLTLLCGVLLVPLCLGAQRADFENLLQGGLGKWEVLGDGIWKVNSENVLFGYRKPEKALLFEGRDAVTPKQFHDWETIQSWLYTKKEYGEFDLSLEYWIQTPDNSGVSIRDPSKARHGLSHPPDFSKTPSKLGYEIQIASSWADQWPSGSIYGLAKAKQGVQKDGEWNSLHIESRKDRIRVRINGEAVAEHPGDPERPLRGPIGLQLHDQFTFAMFRNVWVMER